MQRILVKRLKLSDAGFDTGASEHHRIKKNYRNSRQILRAASRLANHYGSMAGAQGEEIEVLDPELAQRETNPPIILKTDDQVVKAWEIALECTADQKAEPWTVCIVTAAPNKVTVEQILNARPATLAAEPLSGDCILHPDKVVVGTISDLKGFEFRLVLILGCDAGSFPHQGTPRDEVWRDALRLYVAMTRGRDQVFLLHEKEPSSFIAIMDDTVILREEPVFKRYSVAATPTFPPPPTPRLWAPVGGVVRGLELMTKSGVSLTVNLPPLFNPFAPFFLGGASLSFRGGFPGLGHDSPSKVFPGTLFAGVFKTCCDESC